MLYIFTTFTIIKMKKIGIFFLAICIWSSCSSSRKTNQTSAIRTIDLDQKIAQLEKDLSKSIAQVKSLEASNSSTTLAKEECNQSLMEIRTSYEKYSAKLSKMKKELEASFPNNLNEANFSILEEDGRLVITLPNSILYASGQADFDGKALEIIQKLSFVFTNNKGLQILVEGHTDETPLKKGSQYADNWDLSMARAVKITRQLERYGVHPSRLTAAGRGYFAPKNNIDSDKARAMNRRTEIIIRPKITELLLLMNEI